MKFCQNCGAELKEGERVCSVCGAQLHDPAADVPVAFGACLGRQAKWFWAALILCLVNPFLMMLDWVGGEASLFGMEMSQSYSLYDLLQELDIGFLAVAWGVLMLLSAIIMLLPLILKKKTYQTRFLIPLAVMSLLVFLLTVFFFLATGASMNEYGAGLAEITMKAGGCILPLESLLLVIGVFSLIKRMKKQQRGY